MARRAGAVPVRRQLLAATVALVLVASLAGCTGERPSFAEGPDATIGSSTSVAPRPGTVTLERWARGFCASFRSWQTAAAESGEEVTAELAETSDPATVRDSLVSLLETISTRTQSFAAAVRGGEVPDVDDGQQLREALAKRFDDLAATFAEFRDQAAGIDIEDPDRFQAEVDAVVASMTDGQDQIAQSFEEIDRQFPDPAFQQALREACATG